MPNLTELFTDDEYQELSDRFDACDHGRKLRCDECSDRTWHSGNKAGFESGFSCVMTEIRRRAGDAYVNGQDAAAAALRALIKEITERAIKEKLLPVGFKP